ncbi:MAG: HAD family phosphatase [Clostridia bacterium]|nr:HAD family phosphatase [Clostridia bacterium]
MEYKIISTDFDGTLLTSDKKVTPKTKEVLLEYKNNNYIIIGVTARNLSSVRSSCDINMFNYLILNNGTFIYDVENSQEININSIDRKNIIDITNYFEDIAEKIDYCSLNKYYIYKKAITENREFLVQINNIDEINEKIGKINIFLKNNDELDKYKEIIESTFNDIDVIIMSDSDDKSNREWLVLHPKGINKSETLKRLCLKLHISIDEVIFFGDSTNDLQIISQVGLGVAMGNAFKEVKEQAKEITLSNDNDGIAYFLNNFK